MSPRKWVKLGDHPVKSDSKTQSSCFFNKGGRAHKRTIRLTDWEEKRIPEAATGSIERVVTFHMS